MGHGNGLTLCRLFLDRLVLTVAAAPFFFSAESNLSVEWLHLSAIDI